jgi:hypothetical protein
MIDCEIIEAPANGTRAQRELHGWLLLFVTWLGVIGPIYSVGLNGFFALRWQAMYPEATSYFTSWDFWWFIAAREVSRMVAAIVMVARRSAEAVWFAILVLWFSGPVLVTGAWLQFGTVVMPAALVRSGAIAAAATLYLLRSRQVRTVYRFKTPRLDADACAIGREQPSG